MCQVLKRTLQMQGSFNMPTNKKEKTQQIKHLEKSKTKSTKNNKQKET